MEVKVFQRYNPFLIARYVKTFFSGVFFISGIGLFEFNNGKIICPKIKNLRKFSAMREINKKIKELRLETMNC